MTSGILISVSAGYVPFGTVTASLNVSRPLVKFKYSKQGVLACQFW